MHDSCVIISAGNDQSNILKNDSVLVPIDSVSPAPIHDSDVSEQHDKKKKKREMNHKRLKLPMQIHIHDFGTNLIS